jgi:hypothetical protein
MPLLSDSLHHKRCHTLKVYYRFMLHSFYICCAPFSLQMWNDTHIGLHILSNTKIRMCLHVWIRLINIESNVTLSIHSRQQKHWKWMILLLTHQKLPCKSKSENMAFLHSPVNSTCRLQMVKDNSIWRGSDSSKNSNLECVLTRMRNDHGRIDYFLQKIFLYVMKLWVFTAILDFISVPVSVSPRTPDIVDSEYDVTAVLDSSTLVIVYHDIYHGTTARESNLLSWYSCWRQRDCLACYNYQKHDWQRWVDCSLWNCLSLYNCHSYCAS